MFYTYILYSQSVDKYHIGYTSDIEKRLLSLNQGNTRSTKNGIPWILIHIEDFQTKSEAIKREKFIKRMKSRKWIESLIARGRPE